MSNIQRIIDIESKCRFCLGDEGFMSYIFDKILLEKIEKIAKCTSIIINENENLPNKICHVCVYKLDMWIEFKEQFIKSNQILLAHLEPAESNNLNLEINCLKRENDVSQASSAESLSESSTTKKYQQNTISLTQSLASANVECDAPQEASKDSSRKEDSEKQEQCETSAANVSIKNEKDRIKGDEAGSESKDLQVQRKPALIPARLGHLIARRGKTTARRKASTKRWVARKKALLAATGDYGSDTDSIISDYDSKLSPVQKARAKTNADKEVEKRKKLARALKNLQTDMKGEYGFKYDGDIIIIPHSDSEGNKHHTRSQKKLTDEVPMNQTTSLSISTEKENSMPNTNEEQIIVKEERRPTSNICDLNSLSNFNNLGSLTEAQNNEGATDIASSFKPQSIRSEIEVGDSTYIVTSALILSESHYLHKTDHQKSSQVIGDLFNSADENSQERNTDIIDAVQLRRINPKSSVDVDEKRHVERCLNIEVEGTELEALQKVQVELASFVERDMKDRLSNKDSLPNIIRPPAKPKDSFQSLDQQLKAIVETAIRKNIEISSKPKLIPTTKIRTYRNQKVSTFSPAFVKAAMKSKIFQPKVLLMKLDLGRVKKRYKINNLHVIPNHESNDVDIEDRNIMSDERRTDSRLGYRTFDLLDLDSDDNSDHAIVTSTPRVYKKSLELMSEASKTNELLVKKLSGPKGRKKLSLSKKVLYALRKGLAKDLVTRRIEKPICETAECDTTTKTIPLQSVVERLPSKNKFSKSFENQAIKINKSKRCKYSCDICDKTFHTSDAREEHLKSHQPVFIPEVGPKIKKPRMMRCKRCHEIVDARLVRVHTCRSVNFHKCYICNAIFRSEKMLVSHLETHDESEFNIDSIERGQISEKITNVTSTEEITAQRDDDPNTTTNEFFKKEEVDKHEYTCFVCDKHFTDEEILKDHLQQHCNDVSENDSGSDKEQYQCAICGDTLETEDALESHLEKHLCDDQDDNPNLINISNDDDYDKERAETFKCSQCSKECDSVVSLALHVQAHEEERAIAEWEKESTMEFQEEIEFFCAICQEPFNNETELSEHLDVHNSNSHSCFLCEKPFASLEDLQIHVASH